MAVLVVAIFSSVNESVFSKLKLLIHTNVIVSEFNRKSSIEKVEAS